MKRPARHLRVQEKKRSLAARLGIVLISLLCLLVLFCIFIVVLNLPDRDLDSNARAWIERGSSLAGQGTPSAANGGASLWALDAPEGVDAARAGRAIEEAYMARSASQVAASDLAIERPFPADPLILPLELGCIDRASACVSNALSHSSIVRDLAKKRALLLARIDALDTNGFRELPPPAEPHAPSPEYATLIAGYSLSLALGAVDIGDAHLAEGTQRLERMTRVARRLLSGCQTLACKLTAAGMLRRSYLVYSELMSQTTAQDALAQSYQSVADPLSKAELDLTPALAFELQLARRLDAELGHPNYTAGGSTKENLALRAAPLFLKTNATFNREAELADIEAPLASVSAARFASEQTSVFAAFSHRANQIGETSLASLYNPLGRVLASGLPSIENAAEQLHDLEALQAGVRAKALLLTQHVHASSAQAALDKMTPGTLDPYTGAALKFDAANGLLMIPQRGPRPVSQLRLGLDP